MSMNIGRLMSVGLVFMACVSGGPASAVGANSWEELTVQWLDAVFHQPGGRWTATVLAAPPGWEAALAGEVKILGPARGVNKPKKIMSLIVSRRNREQGELWVRTCCLGRVAVAARLLARGVELAPADWQWEERDMAGLSADALREEKALQGKRVKKVLAAHEAICAHALEPKPDIARGQKMTLRIRGEGVVVSADAEALEEGYIGQEIKLKVLSYGKNITAAVADSEAAELSLTYRR
jgi:flagella basal body P-ring formation protein FlgA